MKILEKFSSALRNRGRVAVAQSYLSLRRRWSGRPLWIDYQCIKLPFHGDGDRQEVYYHLDGKKWWNKETRLISPYLKQGGVAVDVGANLGFLTGILSTLAGTAGHVHSFEPSPSVYTKLSEVIKVNNYANVSPYNVGCGGSERRLTLYSPPTSGNASLRPDSSMNHLNCRRQEVCVIKLDDFLGPRLERLNFLKIDTEGYEDEVLAGATGLLQRFRPVVYIELSSEYLASSDKASRLLRDHGYTFDRELALDKSFNGDNFFAFPPNFRS